MQQLQQEKAELTISAGEAHIFSTPHTNQCAGIYFTCVSWLCVCVGVYSHDSSSVHYLTSLHQQCSIRFFSSSAHYWQRDSREVIRGPFDAITWLVAEQLSYTVTHPTCNNGS